MNEPTPLALRITKKLLEHFNIKPFSYSSAYLTTLHGLEATIAVMTDDAIAEHEKTLPKEGELKCVQLAEDAIHLMATAPDQSNAAQSSNPAVAAEPQWRMLEVGEVLETGDEWLRQPEGAWQLANRIGSKVFSGIYRRRITAPVCQHCGRVESEHGPVTKDCPVESEYSHWSPVHTFTPAESPKGGQE